MKRLLLLGIVLIMVSCTDHNGTVLFEYTVINNSGVKIKVEAYERTRPEITPNIMVIYPGDILRKEKTVPLPPHTPGLSFGRLFGYGEYKDSLRVYYYGGTLTKVQSFVDTCAYKDNNRMNPLESCVYNKAKETFIFTKEHFENAQPCNDCE